MKTAFTAAVVAGFAAAATIAASGFGAASAGAAASCKATGNGTSYTVTITTPAGGPQQFGFAFGVGGATITNVVIPGTNGTYSTDALPANATGAWIAPDPMMTGSAVASLTTSGPVTGAFTVVPIAAAQGGSFGSAFTCSRATAGAGTATTAAVGVIVPPTYVASTRVWRLQVNVPGAGTVSALQAKPTTGGPAAKPVTKPSLVQARSLGLKSAGKVTLTLRPTSQGRAMLASAGSIKVSLDVTFAPTGGKPATKLVKLTLRAK